MSLGRLFEYDKELEVSAHPYDNDPGLVKARYTASSFPLEYSYPTWTNPQVIEHIEEWQTIRDCAAGERRIKEKGADYLKPLQLMSQSDYAGFLSRAVFFNMTGRTINALTGIVFNRDPQIKNLPKKLEKAFKAPTKNGISFEAFIKKTCRELITLGRYGVLVDMDKNGGDPYFTGYTAEHILDWQEININGRLVPCEVVLREVRQVRADTFGAGRKMIYTIRRLCLEYDKARDRIIYVQYVYTGEESTMDVTTVIPERIVPTRNGVPLNRIPFIPLGAIDNSYEIDRSPIADIAALNISHYRSYAQLEQSRFFTAMPIYYVQTGTGNTQAEYKIGSSVVWEVAVGEKPGILEMNGHGLGGLVIACEQKEDQISALGGRLMSNQSRSTAESDNALKLKEGNERSILLNIVFSVSEGMTWLLQLWAWWAGVDKTDDLAVELNKEFLTDTLGARELRAVYAMYLDGVVPVTVLHHYLQKAEVIPDWMDVEQFKSLLQKEDEFQNQPDVIAKMKGYNTASERQNTLLTRRELRTSEELARQAEVKATEDARLRQELMEAQERQAAEDRRKAYEDSEKQRKADAEEAEKQRRFQAAEAEKARRQAEKMADKVAKNAAKAKPAPGGAKK